MLDWTEITLSCYQIYPDESHGLFGVTRHLYETMEAFLDEIYGPIEDYFEDDYYLAAAKLLEVTRNNFKLLQISKSYCSGIRRVGRTLWSQMKRIMMRR